MKEIVVMFDSADADCAPGRVHWYDGDSVWISQTEDTGANKQLILVGRAGVPALIDALQKFLAQTVKP